MQTKELLERIACDPRVLSGQPVLRGTRLSVAYILRLLASGATIDARIIIVTSDKEFGARVVREGQVASGVLLPRLRNERAANKLRVLEEVLREHSDKLQGHLVVASEGRIRIVPRQFSVQE